MQTRTVLITGSSRGIGLATAVALARQGYAVYATMRDTGRAGPLQEAAARHAVSIRVLPLDVTDPASARQAVASVLARSGGLYALVNNAGIYMRGYFEDMSDAEIRQVFETNVFGTMAVTRAVLPAMRAAGRGRIITVTSVAGRSGALIASAYCASKFALEGFCESLYQEAAPWGIQVSIIEPAILKSGQWAADYGSAQGALNPASPYYPWYQAAKKMMDGIARTSPTTADDIARTVLRALQSRKPRLRYMVGSRARLVFALRRYIPGDYIERLCCNEAVRRVTRLLQPRDNGTHAGRTEL